MALYAVAGLSKQIELDVPLVQAIIPNTSFYNPYQRPGYKLRTATPNWIQHETANEHIGADAEMHKDWLFGGPTDGDGNRAWVSFHFVVDDGIIYQFIPVDEVTWQAADGNGPGNWECVSCELCVNADGDEAKARHNAEKLCGQIMKAYGQDANDVGRHWDYNYLNDPSERHHCPDHMMNDGYWPTFVLNVGKEITGGSVVAYPQGHDAATFSAKWGCLETNAAIAYPYYEKGVVSTIWRNKNDGSPLVWHFKDKETGREFFSFASGLEIGRFAFGEAFRVLKEAA